MLAELLRRLIRRAARAAAAAGAKAERATARDSAANARAALRADCLRLLGDGDFDRARAACQAALAIAPDDSECLTALASIEAQQGDAPRARSILEQVLRLSPHHAAAHDVMGSVLRAQGDLAGAIACYARALDIEPQRASALSNQALCLRDLGSFDEACERLRRAVEIEPHNAVMRANLAALLFDVGAFDAAMGHVDAILHAQPEHAPARVTRALALLRRGDFARGWPDYEWRDFDPNWQAYVYPEWDGSALAENGLLLVCAEQGLGDQIMFASCLGDLERVAPRCVLECDPRLTALFARSFPAAQVYSYRKKATQPWLARGMRPTAKTRIGSLPLRLRTRRDDFPGSRYLVADSEKVAKWAGALAALGAGAKIGISWRGGVATTRRALRSIDLDRWLPVLRCPGTRIVSLQYGNCGEEIAAVSRDHGVTITHWEQTLADYDETAALVCALDLVIAVQTSIVHLAGALGTPVWVLVPQSAEWRYGESGEEMPWYGSVKLIRQTVPERWSGVIDGVRQALERFLGRPAENR